MAKESNQKPVLIRRASHDDVQAILSVIAPYVADGKILPRTVTELSDLIDTYFVAEVEEKILGCVVLEIYSKKLCEVRSLAVSAEAQGLGIGKKLVAACVALAKNENIMEVMAISSNEEFFQSCGFDFTLPGEKKALFLLP
ncbi:MAG: GNAT family N-acetyltransferase [Candidatus Obscuribacterales bacterium]|nr:GNAT family N-acetyltransferase [Candidatus Obscuribacterales bacterium]